MIVKMKDIINSWDAYGHLLDQTFLPVKIKYSLTKDTRKMLNEVEAYEKTRIALIEKYGTLKPDKTPLIKKDFQDKFDEEFKELMEIEVEIYTEPISTEILLNDKSTLSAKDMFLLEWLILDSKEGEKENNG